MNTLVIAPHADDEVIGCGGLIRKRSAADCPVDVVIGSVGTVRRHGSVKSTGDQRKVEMAKAHAILGVRNVSILFEDAENRLDTVPKLELIGRLDALLNNTHYDEVFIPLSSHHQDHQVLFSASEAALRRGARGYSPRLIAAYESPYGGWSQQPACGRYYVNISDVFEEKREALACYGSQLFPPPHPISLHAIEALASMRGVEAGCRFAEAFYVSRYFEP